MPNTNTNTLVDLIKGLQPSEKRHFKVYVSRHSSSTTPLFLELYNYIDRSQGYCEKEILEQIDGLKKSQLANVRMNLYRQLLTSLRLLHRDNSIEQQIHEQLDYAHILYSKRLYRASLQLLEKARKRALEYEIYPLAIACINFEKRIESQHITRSIDSQSEILAQLSAAYIKQHQRENQFSSLSLQLYGLYLKNGLARDETEVNQIQAYYERNLPTDDEVELNFHERLYLYQSNVWIARMTHDFIRHYRYAQKWVELFTQYPHMTQIRIPLYLKGLHNLLYSQFRGLKYQQFCATLERLKSFHTDGGFSLDYNEGAVHMLFVYIHQINRHFLEGSFTDSMEWLPELESILRSNKYNWDGHRVMVFHYSIACLYFGSGQNKMAIEYLNKVINSPDKDHRQDIQSYARILNLIAHFELGNDVLVGHQLKSVYRFLSNQLELNQVNKAIVRFLRHTPSMERYQIKSAFERLLTELRTIEKSPYERRSFLYLDIISWLESKLKGVPVEQVMQEKFKRLVG